MQTDANFHRRIEQLEILIKEFIAQVEVRRHNHSNEGPIEKFARRTNLASDVAFIKGLLVAWEIVAGHKWEGVVNHSLKPRSDEKLELPNGLVYSPTTGRFHRSSCRHVKRGTRSTVTRELIYNTGAEDCSECHPEVPTFVVEVRQELDNAIGEASRMDVD